MAESATAIKIYGKWSLEDVEVSDISLADYIAVKGKYATFVAHTAGRYQRKKFRKAQCPIVERLVTFLMRNGRNNVQVLVDAIINSGPREDSTRVGSAGVVRRQAVDVSPFRRVNQALYLMSVGAREASFRNVKTMAECLADEIVNASRASSNSYAIKKKDETERVAKANR
eukprot:gene19606-25513_t